MKSFEYTVKDELGIHARPAGMLVKEAKKYEVKLQLQKKEDRRRYKADDAYVFGSKMRTDSRNSGRRKR